jgi:hypothetical protein
MPTTSLMPLPKLHFETALGTPLLGGKVYTYAAGTTNPKATYTDAAGTTPQPNPIPLNLRGEPTNAIFWSGNYRVDVYDALNNLVYSVDNYNTDPAGIWGLATSLAAQAGAALIGFVQAGVNAVVRTIQDKLRERFSIDDYASLQDAFNALGGAEGTGYGANPVRLDLLGKEITFAGTLYVPINVSLENGTLTSSTGKLVFRNPFLANTALRDYTQYWKWMRTANRGVTFNCLTIVNCYIGLRNYGCSFDQPYSALVHVNSNTLWTEYSFYDGSCRFAANAATGAAIVFDGNTDGTSVYSTGSGSGTPDGSFGYTMFAPGCKIDSTAPQVGIKITGGAVVYNAQLFFRGYARGAGGAFLYVQNGRVSHSTFDVGLESFGAAANIISLDALASFWYNGGAIRSASPQMTFAQAVGADLRNNAILVTGAVLQDKTGTVIPSGDTVQAPIRNHLLQRLDYFSGSAYVLDTVTGATVTASAALESRVQYTGQVTSRPNDNRSASSRNWAWRANSTAFGDYVLLESTTNTNDPATARIQVQSGGSCFNTTGTWGVISDARLKENIADARNYLADLRRLRVVKYSLIAEQQDHANLLGLLAQEVEQVFPAMVSTETNPDTGEEIKQVKSSVLIFMLLKAVQELAAQLETKG